MTNGSVSLPIIIGIVLSVAFIAMLIVTIFTLISIKKAELKAKRVIDIPPSALKDEQKQGIKGSSQESPPWPIGAWVNKYLITKGYIKVSNVVRSFFKAMAFLKNSLGVRYKYKLPWYMLIGEEESGKSSLMNGFTHEEIYDDENDDSPCTWWFLKNGVILDIKGSIFLPKVGFNAEDKTWNVILNMLSRYRSERPLNGIILTIPANELYGKNKLAPEELRKKAQYIARKLNFAQNYLGMKLPLYIIITKTDVIPGFQSFCSEIPVRNRQNMLGWSSPYVIDVAYNPRIIDEGFAALENELNEIRMEIFSESFTTTIRDGVFVFPSELLTIKNSFAIYMDTIFKTSSVEERFYFRGFYFTGDSKMMPFLPYEGESLNDETMAIIGIPDADINEVGSISASLKSESIAAKKIFFFEDLLLKKIFAEEDIASPMRSKIYQSNKAIFIAKISTVAFVVIGSYGLFNANDQLKLSKNTLYPSLFKISSLIKSAGDLTYKNLEKDGNEILAECTNRLLAMMQQLNSARFSSLFVPASWFSSINNNLTEMLRVSYQRVVVRTIYMNLILKSRELLNMHPERKSDSISAVLNPYNSKEYAQLKGFVFGLIELEKNIKKFDSLRTSGDPKDLNDLIDYTFHGSLPVEFLDNYQQFRNILVNTPFPPINLSPYKQVAYDTLLLLFQSYLDAIFTTRSENSAISFLDKFILQLSRQNLKEIPDCNGIMSFSKDLTLVCKELGKEGETWLDNDVFESDKEYETFLDGVENLFGKEVAQKLLDITAVNFGYLKTKLKEFNDKLKSDVSSKTRQLNREKEEITSSGIYLMERCLSNLCNESFMEHPGDYQLITDIPEGKMIFWDDTLVQYACDISKSYEQFMATNIKDFPRALQEGITLLAKTNLCAVISGIIAKSQSLVDAPSGLTSEIVSEEILQQQVAELKGVAPKIIALLRILRDDKFGFVFGNLRKVLNKIGFSLLNHVDRLLENQKPYYPSNLTFNYWNGDDGAGHAAFSTADIEELTLYLQLQRSMVLRLSLDFADVIVETLNSNVIRDNDGNHGQLMKWTRIVENAKKFMKKDPLNSITVIEKFIKRTLNSYNLDNITSKISSSDLKDGSGDYFLNIIKEIKKWIMSRAEILLRKRNIARYNLLRDYYIKHLENKYPFCDYDKAQRTMVDADLNAVKEFFRMYDEFGGTPESILDQIYQLGGETKPLHEFLTKIHELRLFFKDFFSDQHESMKVHLEIDFTASKKEEKNVDHLVDRSFDFDDDVIVEPITLDKSGDWYFGKFTGVTLRWASGDNQSDRPVNNQNDPDLIIDGNTAKIQCVGSWSVLRFLRKYKVDTSTDQRTPNQTILRFEVPLSSGKMAKVFVGVTASLPQKTDTPTVATVNLPQTPGKMPQIPLFVNNAKEEALLVARVGLDEPNLSLYEREDASDITDKEELSSNKMKPSKKEGKSVDETRIQENRINADISETGNGNDDVSSILKSSNDRTEEPVIEINEEPIE
jgi:type VI secretion system protein ImpL